ncbi:type II toxin-antitoxin system Phd/YefM family antitoxin [Jannaschia sp. Os4]|nr:type II toxin-antitoxin system Phd/YefM family antitoxin [Jannaschia sp. Os4]
MEASVHEAKTNLSKLLKAVEAGERVIITRHGRPAAELVPPQTRRKVVFGSLKGLVGEPPEGFFDPLSEEELKEWEGD